MEVALGGGFWPTEAPKMPAGPIVGRSGAPSWGPRRPRDKPKKGPEGLEQRLGSELDLTVYKIYVSVDIRTPRSTKYNVGRRANMCTFHWFYNKF